MAWTQYAVPVTLVILASLSFYFALAESALLALGRWQVERLAEQFPFKGGKLRELLREPAEVLASIVLGNTLANAAISGIGLSQALFGNWPFWPTVGSLLLLILIGCEVLPKTLAVRGAEQWALLVAPPLVYLHRLARPLNRFVQWSNTLVLQSVLHRSIRRPTTPTDEEYRELLELAAQQGTLRQSEKEIILEIIRLDQKTAAQVMTPRAQMACIPDDLSIEEMIAAARRHKHRRLPMYDESPDTIVGVLNTKVLLLDPQVDLSEAIEFPSFVPESMNLLQLLKSLQRQQRGLAIALDEFGGTAGVVTTEDILEEIVGEIRTEGEAQSFTFERLGEGRWRVNGSLRIEDFLREYPALGQVNGVETLGGLLVSRLEVVPAPGEWVVFRGLKLTAHVADERRVRELWVETVKRK